MTGLFSKNFKGLLISKHQSLTIDTVTSYIGTERILSYVGVSQNEDIFVKGYNCVFSWWWNFTKSKTFRRLKFNYNWILALSQSYADSHSKFCNSNSLWNNGFFRDLCKEITRVLKINDVEPNLIFLFCAFWCQMLRITK